MSYYTIRNADTHESLGMGGPLDRGKCLSILLMRKNIVLSEWYVTQWAGDMMSGVSDDDEIETQVSADEFVQAKGRI